MSRESSGGESLFDLPETESTIAIAKALGAEVVYNVVNVAGEEPSITDYVTGNFEIDHSNPIWQRQEEK